MKKRFLSFLILLSFAFSAAAQKADVVEQNLRTNVAYLASPALEGRRTGEQGATQAAGYIANLFAQYKLKAGISSVANGKTSRNFLQKFPYTTGVEVAPTGNEFKLSLKNVGGQTVLEENNSVKPLLFSPNAEAANAPVVFAGYGIESAESNFNDYDGLDVTGKVILAFDGNPENDTPRSAFSRFTVHAKAKIAKDKGAVALLLISRDEKFENDRNGRTRYDQTLGETALPVFAISRVAAANILGIKDAEFKTIENLIKMKRETTAKIKLNFSDTSPTVSFKTNLVKKTTDAYNVVGVLEGNDNVLKNEAIIIGAHYDHLGKGGQGSLAVNSTEVHHGADDNASGTAALLELARQFAKEKKNKRTIIFIAFGGEEEGLLGSKHYVNNPIFPLDKTVAMLNMDMVGRLTENKLTVGGIGTATEWKGLVERINERNITIQNLNNSSFDITTKAKVEEALNRKGFNNIIVGFNSSKMITLRGIVPKGKMAEAIQAAQEVLNKPIENQLVESSDITTEYSQRIFSLPFALQLNEDGFGPSDHSSFYGKQIPVLFFFTGTHEDYHKPSDTADKINYAGLTKIVGYVGEIVKAVDANPTKPTYKVAQSSSTGGRMSFNVTIGVVPGYGDATDGMLLDGVRDGSPAAVAGLKAGDKIVKLAGKEIRNVQDYTLVLGELKADTEYEVEVMRGAERLVLKVKPAARR